jgi:hypothetical protein
VSHGGEGTDLYLTQEVIERPSRGTFLDTSLTSFREQRPFSQEHAASLFRSMAVTPARDRDVVALVQLEGPLFAEGVREHVVSLFRREADRPMPVRGALQDWEPRLDLRERNDLHALGRR